MRRKESSKKNRKHWCFFDGPTWRNLLKTEPQEVLSAAKRDFAHGCRSVGVREDDYVIYVVSADVVIPDKVGACVVIDPQSSGAKTSCFSTLVYTHMWDLYTRFRSVADKERRSLQSFHPLGAEGRHSGDLRQPKTYTHEQRKGILRHRGKSYNGKEEEDELGPAPKTTAMLFSPERGLCIDDGKSPLRQSGYAMLSGVMWPIIMREKPTALKRAWKIDVSNCLQVPASTVPDPFVLQNCVAGIYIEAEHNKTVDLQAKLSRYGFYNCRELYRRTEKDREAKKMMMMEEPTKLPSLVPAATPSPAAPAKTGGTRDPSPPPTVLPSSPTETNAPRTASPSASPDPAPTTATPASTPSSSPSPSPATPEPPPPPPPAPPPPPLLIPSSPPASPPEDPGVRRRSSPVFLPPFPKTTSNTTTDRYPKQLSTSVMPSNVVSPVDTQGHFQTIEIPTIPPSLSNGKTSSTSSQLNMHSDPLVSIGSVDETHPLPQSTEEGVIPDALSTARPSEPLPEVLASPKDSDRTSRAPPKDSPLATFSEQLRLPSLHSLPDTVPETELLTARPSEGNRPRRVSLISDDTAGPPTVGHSKDQNLTPARGTAPEATPAVSSGRSTPASQRNPAPSPPIIASHPSVHEILQSLHDSGRVVVPATGTVSEAVPAVSSGRSTPASQRNPAPSPSVVSSHPSMHEVLQSLHNSGKLAVPSGEPTMVSPGSSPGGATDIPQQFIAFPPDHRNSTGSIFQQEGIIEVFPTSVSGSMIQTPNQPTVQPVPRLEPAKRAGVFCLQSRHNPTDAGRIEDFNRVTLNFAGERWEEAMFEMGPSIIQGLETDVDGALRGVFDKRFSVEFTVSPERPSGSKVVLGFRGECTREERERRFKLLYEYDFPEMWEVYRIFCGDAASSPRVMGETAKGSDAAGRYHSPPASSGEANIDLLFGGFKWKQVLEHHRQDVEKAFIQDVQDAIRRTGLPISAPRRVHLCGRDNVLDTTTSLEFVHMPPSERKACQEAIAKYTYPKLLNAYQNYSDDTAWVVVNTPSTSPEASPKLPLEVSVHSPRRRNTSANSNTGMQGEHLSGASLTDIPPSPHALEHHEDKGSHSRSQSHKSSKSPSPANDSPRQAAPLDKPEVHQIVFPGHQWKKVIRHHHRELERAAVKDAEKALKRAKVDLPDGGFVPKFSMRSKKAELSLKVVGDPTSDPVSQEDVARRQAVLQGSGFLGVWKVYYSHTKIEVSSPSSAPQRDGVLHAEYSEQPIGKATTKKTKKNEMKKAKRTPAFSSTERQDVKEESDDSSSSDDSEIHGVKDQTSSMLTSSRPTSLGSPSSPRPQSSSGSRRRKRKSNKKQKRLKKGVSLGGNTSGGGGLFSSGESSFEVFFGGGQWNKVLEQYSEVTERLFMQDIHDALEAANLTMPVIYNTQLIPGEDVMEASAALQFAHESADEQKVIRNAVKCYTYPKMLAFYAEVTSSGFNGKLPSFARHSNVGFRWPTLQGREKIECSLSLSPPPRRHVSSSNSSTGSTSSSGSSSSSSATPPLVQEKVVAEEEPARKPSEPHRTITFSIQLPGDLWENLLLQRKTAMEEAFREDVQEALKIAALPPNAPTHVTFTLKSTKVLKIAANLSSTIPASTSDTHYKALKHYDYPKLLSLYHAYSTLRRPRPSELKTAIPISSSAKGGSLDRFTLKFPGKLWRRLIPICRAEFEHAAKKDLIEALRPSKEEMMNKSTVAKIQIFGLKLQYSQALNGMKLSFALRDRTANQEQRDVQAIEAYDFHELWNAYWKLRELHIPSSEWSDEDDENEGEEKDEKMEVGDPLSSRGLVEVVEDREDAKETRGVTSRHSSTNAKEVPIEEEKRENNVEQPSASTSHPASFAYPLPLFDNSANSSPPSSQRNRSANNFSSSFHLNPNRTVHEGVPSPILTPSPRPTPTIHILHPLREPMVDNGKKRGRRKKKTKEEDKKNRHKDKKRRSSRSRSSSRKKQRSPPSSASSSSSASESSEPSESESESDDSSKTATPHQAQHAHHRHSSSSSSARRTRAKHSPAPTKKKKPSRDSSRAVADDHRRIPVPPLDLPERTHRRRYHERRPPPLNPTTPSRSPSPPEREKALRESGSSVDSSPLGQLSSHRSRGRHPHDGTPHHRTPGASMGDSTGLYTTPQPPPRTTVGKHGRQYVTSPPISPDPHLKKREKTGASGYRTPASASLSAFSASADSSAAFSSSPASSPPSSKHSSHHRHGDHSHRSNRRHYPSRHGHPSPHHSTSPSPRFPQHGSMPFSSTNSSYNSSAFSSSLPNSGRF